MSYLLKKQKKPSSKKKKALKAGLVAGVLIAVLLGAATALPAYLAYKDALALKAGMRDFKDGLILQDLDHMERALNASDAELRKMQKHTALLNWLRVIPFIGSYKADLDRALRAGRNGLDAGRLVIQAIRPNAKLLGFSTENQTGAELSGQERIKGIVQIMPKLAENIDPVAEKVALINKDIAKINPNRYPRKIGKIDVQASLRQVIETANALAEASPQFKQILTVLPQELGLEKPKTYLVLFQNDKELRSTGGFWTAYALITLDKGAITEMTSGDMYFLDIDKRASYYPPAPYPIATFLKLDDWYIRDVNIYPDFRQSVEKMGEFWERIPGLPAYDAVVGIDTVVVEDLLRAVGEVEVGGYGKFNADNVTYQLEMVSNVLKKNQGDRKDILGGLMREIVNRIFGLPNKEYNELLKTGFANLAKKHILLYFKNPSAQEIAERFNYAGRINEKWQGDYLHINDTNLAGRKGNWWITETISKTVGKDGRAKLTITYTNTGAYHSEWNTGYRDWVRVYVPKGSKLLNSQGSLYEVTTGEEYNKTYFAGYLAVDPKQTVVFSLEYQLPTGIDAKNLLIQKQPGVPAFPYQVEYGKKTRSFSLERDTEIEF